MIIKVLNSCLRVEPWGERELLDSAHDFTDQDIQDSAVFSMAHEAAITGVEQSIGPMRVLPPDDEGHCAVFFGQSRLLIDPEADEIYCE